MGAAFIYVFTLINPMSVTFLFIAHVKWNSFQILNDISIEIKLYAVREASKAKIVSILLNRKRGYRI